MKKNDVSIHFTIKNQTVKEVEKKLEDWYKTEEKIILLNGNVDNQPRPVLHHCFLPKKILIEKNIPLTVWDFLENVSDHIICWYGATMDGNSLAWDRRLMLENIKKTNGIAIFVGNIVEGVKEDYDMAMELGIDCIVIP